MSDDPFRELVRAEAEGARAEMRSWGYACPSCDMNMADLPHGHALAMWYGEDATLVIECSGGEPVPVGGHEPPLTEAEFKAFRDASNIVLLEDINRRFELAVIGPPAP